MTRCICGCGQRAVARHHVIYRQTLRGLVPRGFPHDEKDVKAAVRALVTDERNLVPVAQVCHDRHHLAFTRLPLAALPDAVFEFAGEVLGARAPGYLDRYYSGLDVRLDAMLVRSHPPGADGEV